MKDLPPGLYESILTERLDRELASLDRSHHVHRKALQAAEAPDRLALHLSSVVEKVLASLPIELRVKAGAALVRELVRKAAAECAPDLASEAPHPSGDILTEITARLPDGRPAHITPPVVPFVDTALMTNAPGEPRLASQLASEIPSAERIDLIMAFIRRSGLAPMREALKRHASSNARPLRVLTTTYTGTTEGAALEELQQLGAKVRVSYDTSTTRLHAKSWLFHRPHGLSTGYIGSSNLTRSAQVTGLEWNLRVSAARNRTVIERMAALFESCWNSSDFLDFDRVTFRDAMEQQKAAGRTFILLPGIELRLEPFQERMLELIAIERERGRHRNLLVSATGTGKTVMASVDYARLRSRLPRARLLFVAHRKEILQQSRAMFCLALRDSLFGEFWVDGKRPEQFDNVFASIQSIANAGVEHLPADHFDVVIVDEFHHAAAPTYRALLDHLKPRELLGLTATPERSDGESITDWFEGRISAELRLWDAIDQQRLVPFAYYGVADHTDLTQIPCRRGQGYDLQALTNVLTADHAWALFVIRALVERVDDIDRMHALGFCASVGHARYMAQVFNDHGIAASAVSGQSSSEERESALRRLASRDLKVVFSVDLFNEGVDVPSVDTLLMLRPTESPTVFLQQLGRGLRRHDGKAQCVVLDFVGQHRREFNYSARYKALLGGTRKQLIDQLEQGFPFLPSGCHLALEGVARDRVLQSLRDCVPRGLAQMGGVVRTMKQEGLALTLANFIDHSGLELEEVYLAGGGSGRCWSDVLQAAGESIASPGPHEAALRKACARLLHWDDGPRMKAYRGWLQQVDHPPIDRLDRREKRWLRMLLAGLTTSIDVMREASLRDALAMLWQHPQVRAELCELIEVLSSRNGHLGFPLAERPEAPLQVHGRYSRPEIQAAFADCNRDETEHARVAVPTWREGVKWMEHERCDVLLITLNKTEKRFSPTTRYRDYAISRDLLHWESQSGTRSSSPSGMRYQHHVEQGSAIMIFVRVNAEDRAFHFLGPARYVEHRGEMPMQITWRLAHPLPGDLLTSFRAVAA